MNREFYLAHSAKGSTWEKKDHKYIKKENGRYYYSDKEIEELSKKDPSELTDEEIEAVYQFPDKVRENIETKKKTELARKGKERVDEIMHDIQKMFVAAFEDPYKR